MKSHKDDTPRINNKFAKGPGNYVEAPGLRARDTDVMRKALGLGTRDRVTPQHAMSLTNHPDVNVQKAAKSFLSGVHGAM